MAYFKNPTDKQMTDLDRFNSHSAIRFPWWKRSQQGVIKNYKAYDLQPELQAVSEPDAVKQYVRTIGSHNDRPARFDTPGKA